MRTINRLTSDICAGAIAQSKPVKFFDGNGLYLYVTPLGTKNWRVAYRIDGKAQTASIGRYPEINLEKARALCEIVRARVKSGVKPIRESKAAVKKDETALVHKDVVDALHYDSSTGVFTWRYPRNKVQAGEVAGTLSTLGYRRIGIDGAIVSAHRLAWFVVHGVWPTLQIDHINGVKDDNRIANLRDVAPLINTQNRRVPKQRIGLYGVRKHSSKGWSSCIDFLGKRVSCGPFNSPEEAHEMYLVLKRRLHDGCTI